ncbi:MAG: UDP-N-acetylmuramoyl-L-alanine--D-glutamate ligase [Synergistaceae bacterium]|jgi:UDP-N-acetylmuramoylalanine--D-glutamate ligase|nr:UDP-N-acetylmuramoyl-L-alanine--D-glutamate ligase [Synergistaceae bacterium]
MYAHNEKASLSGERIAVLGGGVSGTSLALLAAKKGADVLLSDAKKIPDTTVGAMKASGVAYEEFGHTDAVLACDRAVTSSGFPPSADIIKRIIDRGLPITGELDFVAPYLKGRFIGVTGSNGKTTTTSLLGWLLRRLDPGGFKVATVGNIGSAIADIAGEEHSYIVAELSSFQLYWSRSLVLDGAIVTNIAPDHIDWHGSYKNYTAAKAKILSFVRPEKNGASGFTITRESELDILKPDRGRSLSLAWGEPREKGTPGHILLSSALRRACLDDEELFRFDDTSLLGGHNMENVAMAMAAVSALGVNPKTARNGLASYVPPPHRCSMALVAGGVKYIDDSKGTNVAATVTALSSIDGRKIIILGGRGKGEDYGALVAPLLMYAKSAILIGEASGEIANALEKGGYKNFTIASGMEEAVRSAHSSAAPGDVVLLSPACTSWDAYNNYGERGEHFASLVREIAGGKDARN